MTAVRVLVIDDDPALLEALPETLRLRMSDVVVETCASAASALERIMAVDYDAIVSDIKMPGMDGLALLNQIRTLRPDVPTLLITGHGEHDLAVQSLRGGAFDYIQKPIDREYFVASLGRAIHARTLKRQIATQQAQLELRAAELENIVATRTRELRDTAERVRALTEVATAIHAAHGLAGVLRSVAEAACRLGGAGFALAGAFRGQGEASRDPSRAPHQHMWEAASVPEEITQRMGVEEIAAFCAHVCKHQVSERIDAAAAHPFWQGLSAGRTGPWIGDSQPALIGIQSVLAVPVHARTGRTLGAIILGDPAPRRFTPETEIQIDALARQAAIALENALLYERERGIAETLQRSLLPERLPEIPGVAMSARYLSGTPEVVGGDWYDAFPLATGQIALVIGDVAGRGVWAAAVMGQIRNAVRAFASEGSTPALLGERLNRLLDRGTMATLLYLVFDLEAWTLRYMNYGHVPPLVLGPDGEAAFLEGGAPPLGTAPPRSDHERTVVLRPGSTLMLYTDGLVEIRGEPIDAGLQRLERVVRRTASLAPNEALEQILAEMLRDRAMGDDVAVMMLRATALDPARFQVSLPAMPDSLPQLRRTLRRWLDTAGVSPDDAYEIITACHEACANAVEHAYGPLDQVFSVEAMALGDAVAITVRDAGRWRPPQGSRRGLGLQLMQALMDDVDVTSGEEGTNVTMRRRVTRRVTA